MSREEERIDRPIVPRAQADIGERPWWRPSLLAGWFIALVAIDALILLIAPNVRSSGSDAAGNGLANAFQTAFVQAGALLVGCLALLFMVIRHKGARIGLTVMLGLVTLLLPMLLLR